jgi:RNA polymerase sigma-70 factor (ECF subfamily)
MAEPSKDINHWLAAARAGSTDALGQALEGCRAYLLLIAHQELDPALRGKAGASDLVQETLADAVHDFERFEGTSADELRRWLRRLLLNNLVSFIRRYRDADKRDLAREVPLDTETQSDPERGLASTAPSPSKRAMRQEQARAIQQALARLPEEYRQVLLLRFQEDLSFEEIGQRLQLSPNAARKRWARALKRLQQESGDAP